MLSTEPVEAGESLVEMWRLTRPLTVQNFVDFVQLINPKYAKLDVDSAKFGSWDVEVLPGKTVHFKGMRHVTTGTTHGLCRGFVKDKWMDTKIQYIFGNERVKAVFSIKTLD